jgi:hypothetical protein
MVADNPTPPLATGPTVDCTHRRWAAASAVIGIIQRDRPEAVQQLRTRVSRVFGFRDGTYLNDETSEVVAAWCNELKLGCEAIQSAAFALALSPPDGPPQVWDEPSVDDELIFLRNWLLR